MRPWVWLGLAVLVGCKESAPAGVCSTDGDCAGGGVCTAYRTCADVIDVPVGSLAPGSCAEPLPPARCALARGEPWVPDHQGARDMLPGRWLRCSGTGVIEPAEVGLEFTQAGQWFQLVAGSDGRIERATSSSSSGTWSIDQVGSDWQLMMLSLSNIISVFKPALVRSPLMMRPVSEQRDLIYVYAPTADCGGSPAPDASAPDAAPSGPCAEPLPPPACEQPSTRDVTVTANSLPGLLAGRWLYCGGFSLIAPEAIGFEATSDGHVYRLTTDEQGRLIRATGFDSRGFYETRQDQDQVEVRLYIHGGGPTAFHAEFRDNPRNLFAVSDSTSSRYVEAPAPRCP